ncbi:hypothetical protein H5410_002639 [Solanum commersonii]|uniref:Uncharacterized protein n=1 Tax=Solanum commersonii TaxID=4109 RepID=A0A9J6B2V5_SOLCO|nr:hypothetical protein H5410_002639 [Solanum commersonii]
MVSLYPLGLFGSCTAIWIYWSGLQPKMGFSSCLYSISTDFLDAAGSYKAIDSSSWSGVVCQFCVEMHICKPYGDHLGIRFGTGKRSSAILCGISSDLPYMPWFAPCTLTAPFFLFLLSLGLSRSGNSSFNGAALLVLALKFSLVQMLLFCNDPTDEVSLVVWASGAVKLWPCGVGSRMQLLHGDPCNSPLLNQPVPNPDEGGGKGSSV